MMKWPPDLLSQLRKKISGKPSVDVIFGDHISIDHNGNSTYSTTEILPKTREECFKGIHLQKITLVSLC